MIRSRFVCGAELAFLTALAVCACQRRIRSLSEWRDSCKSMLKSHHEVVREEEGGLSWWNIQETLSKKVCTAHDQPNYFQKMQGAGGKKYMWDAFLTSLHTGWNCEAEKPYGIIKISVSSSFFSPYRRTFSSHPIILNSVGLYHEARNNIHYLLLF